MGRSVTACIATIRIDRVRVKVTVLVKKGLVVRPSPFFYQLTAVSLIEMSSSLILSCPLTLISVLPGHESEEHFIPTLFTAIHVYGRIRIEWVLS